MQCVVRLDGAAHVYVRDGDGWKPRAVEVGLDNNRMIRILSGVKPGEEVLLAPPVTEESKDEK